MVAPLATIIVMVAGTATLAEPTVLNFDDLPYPYILTGSGYAGLTWELGNNAADPGVAGRWVTSDPAANGHAHSPPINVVNGGGSTLAGITFPTPVAMGGGYVAVQGNGSNLWATSVCVHGYLAGQEVATTNWLTSITTTPAWLDMSVLTNVDRIVFESSGTTPGVAGFGLDDLTFTPIPEPASLAALGFVGAGLLRRRRRGA
jgi:hypothetical protein